MTTKTKQNPKCNLQGYIIQTFQIERQFISRFLMVRERCSVAATISIEESETAKFLKLNLSLIYDYGCFKPGGIFPQKTCGFQERSKFINEIQPRASISSYFYE